MKAAEIVCKQLQDEKDDRERDLRARLARTHRALFREVRFTRQQIDGYCRNPEVGGVATRPDAHRRAMRGKLQNQPLGCGR
jgi:hypothetical protein